MHELHDVRRRPPSLPSLVPRRPPMASPPTLRTVASDDSIGPHETDHPVWPRPGSRRAIKVSPVLFGGFYVRTFMYPPQRKVDPKRGWPHHHFTAQICHLALRRTSHFDAPIPFYLRHRGLVPYRLFKVRVCYFGPSMSVPLPGKP